MHVNPLPVQLGFWAFQTICFKYLFLYKLQLLGLFGGIMVPRTKVTKREVTDEIREVTGRISGLRNRLQDCNSKLSNIPPAQRQASWSADINRAEQKINQADQGIVAAKALATPAAAMKKVTLMDAKIEDADDLLANVLPALIKEIETILAPLRQKAELYSNTIPKYAAKVPILVGAAAATVYSLVKGAVNFSKEFSTTSDFFGSVWAGFKVPWDLVGQLGHAISGYPIVAVSAVAAYSTIKSIGNVLNLRAKQAAQSGNLSQTRKEKFKQIANEIVSGITKTAIVSGVTLVAAKLIDNWLYLINSDSVFAPDRMSLFDAIPATLKQISGWVASAPAVLPAGIALGLVMAAAIYNKINKKI